MEVLHGDSSPGGQPNDRTNTFEVDGRMPESFLDLLLLNLFVLFVVSDVQELHHVALESVHAHHFVYVQSHLLFYYDFLAN